MIVGIGVDLVDIARLEQALRRTPALAERLFREGSSKAPLDANMLNNLGIALEGQGRIEEARQSFAAALEKNPGLAQARENLRRVGG